MATFLFAPVKRTYDVDLIKPLRGFITTTFTNVEAEDYNKALEDFNKLRNQMMSKSLDRHEAALEVLYRYYDQLVAIESKLPITENQIRITFKWQDAFEKQSLFGGKTVLAISLSTYEQMCVLYNIAAMQSGIAECQGHDSDDGLKMSAKLFQQAAGTYNHMKETVLSHLGGQEPTPDLKPETLNFLCALMVAQAQDCFYKKAVRDNMKDAIMAKLAQGCSDLYSDALKLANNTPVREIWPKEWVPVIAGKQACFHALAEYHQSKKAKADKCYGEEIARLKHAEELMIAAITRGGKVLDFTEKEAVIKQALAAAKKDNDFIYHDRVPDFKGLPAVVKAAMAKPTPMPSALSNRFTDLFEKIVPLAVHGALASFESRKSAVVNVEVGKLRESTQFLNSVLVSLNLPAALEDLTGEHIPDSLVEKAMKVKEVGGIECLNKLMRDLPQLLQRNKEILNEGMKALDEEQKSDDELKKNFQQKWTRTPSLQLTEPMRKEGDKYKAILDNASHADTVVQQRYAEHKAGIDLLSKSQAELKSMLPSANPTTAVQGSGPVVELRKLMKDVETIKTEREVIEHEIQNNKTDMSARFMAALAQDGAINEESLSEQELDNTFSSLKQQVRESIHSQEVLLSKIQQANTEFSQAKASNSSAVQRDEMMRSMASAFDMFMELKSNLEEGTKFYNDLTHLLVKFQSKVGDFCFARKTEKEELMKDLQDTIAREPTQTNMPATPSYQQPGAPSTRSEAPVPAPRVPPARPPPLTAPQPTAASSAPSQPPAQSPYSSAPSQPPYGAAQPQQPYGMPYPTNPYNYAAAPPMPSGYNPYANYGQGWQQPPQAYPPQNSPYGQQPYPPYPQQGSGPPGAAPPYPQQRWQ